MKNILEIPIIGSRINEKERLYSLLSDSPLRNFQGLKFGSISLDKDHEIYLYFLNQENEKYYYLWDLIIPNTIACLVMCEWNNQELFESNLALVEKLEEDYSTPIHICVFKLQKKIEQILLKEGLLLDKNKRLLFFDPEDKNSAKNILLNIIG